MKQFYLALVFILGLFGFFALDQWYKSTDHSPKYEYKVVSFMEIFSVDVGPNEQRMTAKQEPAERPFLSPIGQPQLQSFLNQKASEGWEFVGDVADSLIFRKPSHRSWW